MRNLPIETSLTIGSKHIHSTDNTLSMKKTKALNVFASAICLIVVVTLPNMVYAETLDLQFEARANFRDSQQSKFPTAFPFPPIALPPGASSAFVETVEEGSHTEISQISLAGKWRIAQSWQLQFKLDAIDLYDRNPTSSDRKFDIDALFLRYGEAFGATRIPALNSLYAQVGKFKKFEQQRERRTESYGVVSIAFNRFEDSGLEAGFDLASGFYGRLSYTTGNPVFMRDGHALAGDNGTEEFRVPPNANPNPRFKSGIVMLYDAEIEDFDLSSDPELGIGIGYRVNSSDQTHKFDLLGYHYERNLADTRKLRGTFYGGDLDLFDLGDVPGAEGIRLPFNGRDKTESGLTAWYHAGNFALFSQYVRQDLANLDRSGFEVELSYVFDTRIPITPVIRYSELHNDFVGHPAFPAPSLSWDWRKADYALNLDFSDNLRLIVEFSDNEVERAGRWEAHDELLITLRWQGNYNR